MESFWQQLKKPAMVLAPMADVTDAAFRRIIARYGKPDVFWTEFVSADGLWHTREKKKMSDGENPLMQDLIFSSEERPIVAQFFSSNPEMMEYAAALAREIGFDGVDINMGCPDRSVEKQGGGAALIKNPALARELIRAAKRGAGTLPVSVKTRIGYNKNELDAWLPELLAEEPAVLTLHARTRKEMSLVPARWEHVREAVLLRDKYAPETLIFGNGDIVDIADAQQKVSETGADGAMLGRAIFGNPWLFNNERSREDVSLSERLAVLLEHVHLYEELLPHKSFSVMKKHFKAYVSGFPRAAELRDALMQTNSGDDVELLLQNFHIENV